LTSDLASPPSVHGAQTLTDDTTVYRPVLEPHNCFVCGETNPLGMHLQLRVSGDRAWADVVLGRDHEGWHGVAHGGIVSALLDEVMAWSLFRLGNWGFTASMTTRYRRPIEIGQPIHVEGWATSVRGRLMRTAARITDAGGVELATAEGTYLAAPRDRRDEMLRRYAFRLEPVEEVAA
jgi:acyl-coenzyme A thioesterase PaaI-like protein